MTPDGPHAAAGQLPGGPEAGRRASDLADQSSGSTCSRWSARATSAGSERSRPSSGWRRRSRRMSELERFRGHFYNWYDTRDLRPLEPQYVSSVDSGNLAGHLIALANACREWIDRPDCRMPARIRRHRGRAARSRARRCTRFPTTGARRRSRGSSSTDALDALAAALRRRPSLPHAERHRDARLAELGAARRRSWSTSRGRWRASAATTPDARPARSGRRRRSGAIESHAAATSRRRAERRATSCIDAWLALEADGARDGARDGVRLPARPRAQAACRSATGSPTASSIRAATTCSPPRRASRASSPSPRATCRRGTGSGSGAPLTPVGQRRGADLLVGLDVRVPDAVAGHARAGRQPARADQPPRRAPADRLRRRARRALGRLGVGLQRARPRAHLPVLELRRARPRPEARPRARTSSSRPTRRRWRRWSIRRPRRSNFARLAAAGARGRYGFYEALDYTRSRAARGRRRSRSCAPTWRTTRA